MPAEYRIDIRDTSGFKVAEVTDYNWVSYSKRIAQAGVAQFELLGAHPLLGMLGLDYQVEVWRRNLDVGLAWYADFYGLYRGTELKNADGIDLATLTCPGQMSLLARRSINYYASTVNRSAFTAVQAETIAKTLVSYNAGENALVSNGRFRNGVINGISIETDLGRGSALDWACANVNLLQSLADLSYIGGGDFDLVKTGPAAWEFRWYAGQLGADRHTTVLFSIALGNMEAPVYTYNRTDEKTVAVVGGSGTGSARPVVVAYGADYAASNDIEEFVNGSSFTTVNGLTAEGNRQLYASRARQRFKFAALQIPSTYYGLHYRMGDIVTAGYKSFSSSSEKIMGVTVAFSGQDMQERVTLEVMNV